MTFIDAFGNSVGENRILGVLHHAHVTVSRSERIAACLAMDMVP
jgi:hypothetical protein